MLGFGTYFSRSLVVSKFGEVRIAILQHVLVLIHSRCSTKNQLTKTLQSAEINSFLRRKMDTADLTVGHVTIIFLFQLWPGQMTRKESEATCQAAEVESLL